MTFKHLNTSQLRAVQSTEGPVMIIAGPGTGKTTTLIARLMYLIHNKKVKPQNILALTFTEKASQEIIDRLHINQQKKPWVGTFHALGYELIPKEKNKNLIIVTERKRKEILRKLRLEYKFNNIPLRELQLKVSRFKQTALLNQQKKSDLSNLIEKYNQYLKKENLFDYDDLLIEAYTSTLKDRGTRESLQNRFHYIMIDEFQDTNELQYELIKLVVNNNRNIFVIGDPLQSIYSFQGAVPKIFETFKKDFIGTHEIFLEKNYRSGKNIIQITSQLFPGIRIAQSETEHNGNTSIVQTYNAKTEAEWILSCIEKRMGGSDLLQASDNSDETDKKTSFRNFAVLYRTHHLGKVIQEVFSDSGMPYQVVGGGSPFEQKEIQMIIHTIQFLNTHKTENLESFKEKERNKIKGFHIERIINLTGLIDQIIKLLDIENMVKNKPRKINNLRHFLSMCLHYDSYKDGLEQFLSYIDFLENNDYYDKSSEKITLSTMHASKGLEFDYVFICGFEEGIIPFKKTALDTQNSDEEKRLLYVAMTRARKELFLLHTLKRFNHNNNVSLFYKQLKNRLLKEIRDDKIDTIRKNIHKWKLKKSQLKLF
ncbi:hypothetical protein A3H80_02150 [Candidatus Roizmanbacteria bacterium RIFCSPLOWO2_02_FULL_37_19]|uniref:DNA 3'-5' helicase n=1 Tax=Candidatus Roizmanbacteria bacterium RIFCSPHIGHO2_02_FULL_37_24 TaxID=1802037 RepID=A0A1F7H0A2_9BACT|nr:MAG: hypothetical protein A2862_02735 [Candidatus Roizmanbacteria bacterium RIFCSPHIGHO2_01_FULL_38_41]OGK24535.1 MAG: hypothetical protein A3C24_03230 [Candidatus Roizmanbacteria bacterium RIFCSPHIGHO2_02_FULL_37_24]OGK31989.1 MAG: hypothetical protein A3E10_04570 [Candidatus Roizmanbacteria bacterium RIFCSPHIGHO2_12_FULL_37_23]OGK43790.1 MAG: hypothetical protein A2956_04695 [Candidatus Roizmanbacteria bacterium RIFCSPLOWO2_01_FULL_37_57]OGK54344.1 MAG: hypothetical protein A3H80_02150 [Ca